MAEHNMIVKEVNGHKFVFVCEWIDSRNGFSHVCTLFDGDVYGKPLANERYHYINRTWEAYEFQSVMLGCVAKAKERILSKAIDEYKFTNSLQKLTAKRKQIVCEAVEKSKEWNELEELYNQVKCAKYGTEEEKERLESLDAMLSVVEILFGENGLLRNKKSA